VCEVFFSVPAFVDFLRERGFRLVTAESCTGGLIAKLVTDVAGSSDVFWGAFVTYSNDAKTRCLGVSEDTVRRFGAVSRETVEAMARGALAASGASACIAVSGVAGPGGGSPEKPVGTVFIGARAGEGRHREEEFHFCGTREEVRRASAYKALAFVEELLRGG
jgi:nicotinamide-nucleotide amidase